MDAVHNGVVEGVKSLDPRQQEEIRRFVVRVPLDRADIEEIPSDDEMDLAPKHDQSESRSDQSRQADASMNQPSSASTAKAGEKAYQKHVEDKEAANPESQSQQDQGKLSNNTMDSSLDQRSGEVSVLQIHGTTAPSKG